MKLGTTRSVQRYSAVALALLGFLVAAVCLSTGKPNTAFAALAPVILGLVFYGMVGIQLQEMETAIREVEKTVSHCGKFLFDEPAPAERGYDLEATATNYTITSMQRREKDNDSAFTATGSCDGVRVSVGSHASILARQNKEPWHTYSHVIVDVLGLDKPFRLTREDTPSKVGKAIGAVTDVTVRDRGFDKAFIVSADDKDFARAVLTAGVRRRLLALTLKARAVSAENAVGGVSVMLSKRGLALRWPGPITPDRAKEIRDLLLDMRASMLAHQNRVAIRVGAERGSYRIAADERAESDDEVEARARNEF